MKNRPTKEEKEQVDDEMCLAYSAVFLGSDLGKKVLADLRAKFPTEGTIFDPKAPDPLKACFIDGQRKPLYEINAAIRRGCELSGTPYPAP